MIARWIKYAATCATFLLLAACGQGAKPKDDAFYGVKIGKTYNVNGEAYTPQYQPYYEEEGMASWYGPGFHGKKTSYGESFDTNSMTAAHRTLPLPSMVEVTNLANGRKAIVRVNDRGPFSKGRVIDVSQAAAEKLGMIGTGTARVHVRYLKDETEKYIVARGGNLDAFQTAALNSTPAQMYQRGEELAADAPAAPVYTVASNDLASPIANDAANYAPASGGTTSRDLAPAESMVAQTLENADVHVPTTLPATMPIGKLSTARTAITPTGGSSFVQVGAFGIEENAKKTANQLAIYGNATVIPFEASGRKVYRVRLGPLAAADAQKSLEQVLSAGFKDAKIVR